jgi:hypothetical protein
MRIAKNKTKLIGDFEYVVTPLPAGQANDVLRRLLAVVGGGLEKLGPGADAAAAIGGMIRSLDQHDQDHIIRWLAGSTQVRRGPQTVPLASCFDEHFAGEIGEEIDWLVFALEVNFGRFFQRLKVAASGAGLQAKIASALNSRLTSTGTSTGSPSAEGTQTASS